MTDTMVILPAQGLTVGLARPLDITDAKDRVLAILMALVLDGRQPSLEERDFLKSVQSKLDRGEAA
ncbi:MAG: hypothetical protein E7K72_19355 [Roseomonas mucosa]|nr:hypothetical protein [Roseomonas mucosa]